jgi:hypothetical protein
MDIETKVNIANTKAFIAARPVSVTLIPHGRVRTPAGGFKEDDGEPRAPQTFRIIETGIQTTPAMTATEDGEMRVVLFWMLGMPDAKVARHDWWIDSVDGREMEIADIVRSNGYEVRLVVIERGR